MNNLQNIDISLHEIVKTMSNDGYLIPKFQRNFIWDRQDIVDLGDSIIRGYPISSLLIMPENGTLKVGSHSLIQDFNFKNEINPLNTKFYVLDGQQRLTSISKLFLGCDKKNEYYFDLLSIINETYPDDNIRYNTQVTEMLSNKTSSPLSESFCRYFSIGKDNSEKPTRQNNRFISGKSIIEGRFGSVISKFLEQLKSLGEQNIDKYTDYLNALLGAVSKYSIPTTQIDKDSDLNIIVRVFEKVNSTGKKLTLFDLINAKSFQTKTSAYSIGLTDYVTSSLMEKMKQPFYTEAIKKYFAYNEVEMSFERLDRIVRVLEVSYLLSKAQNPSLFNSVMLGRDADFWFAMWDKNIETFLKTISWLHQESLIGVAQSTFLEYIIGVFIANPKILEVNIFKQRVKRYAYYLNLKDIPFNKSNLDIVIQFYDMSDKILNKIEARDISYSLDHLSGEDILQITPSSTKFDTILNIFYADKIKGLFTVDLLGNELTLSNLNNSDKHHIYPKSKIYNFKPKSAFNSIANYVLVCRFHNREIIKDKTPAEYIPIIANNVERIKFYCNQNLLDYEDLLEINTEGDALEMIRNRANKIAFLLSDYIRSENNE